MVLYVVEYISKGQRATSIWLGAHVWHADVRRQNALRRVELAQLLIDEARRLDIEGRTRFHFQAPLESLDLERRVARFGAAEGAATEVCPCVLLLAALAARTSSTGPAACNSSKSMHVVNAHDMPTMLAQGLHGDELPSIR